MWKKWSSDFLAILIIIVISLCAMWNLTKPGLPMFHDSNPHIARMIAFHTALLDGQHPPMWAKEVLGGIGSPVMMLNYQLPYFVGEAWVRLGLTYFDSYKLTLALSFLLSGLAMYACIRQRYKALPALLGSLVYLLAPYRLVDIYVRGAYGEALAFIFPPLILMGYYRKSIPWLTLGWAGLFLTHPLASAAFTLFFLGYSLFVSDKKEKIMVLQRHGIAFGIAFMIAAFNLLPTLALTKYTYYTPADSSPLSQFPTFHQLLYSPWGYGVSVPGPADGMSFEIGFAQLFVICTTFVYWILAKVKNWKLPSEVGYTLVMIGLCVFFMLPFSTPLYILLGLTKIIDLPWRLLLCVVFATGWLASYLASRVSQKYIWTASVIIIFVLWVLVSGMMLPPPKYWHKTDKFFARETGDSYGEYAPIYRETRDSAPFWLRAESTFGQATVVQEKDLSNEQVYWINSDEASVVRVNTSYFPGWHIYIDSQEVVIDLLQNEASKDSLCYVTTRTQDDIDDSGQMACHISAGRHTLMVKYLALPVQKIGDLLSLLGIGGFLWSVYQSFFPRIMKAKRSSKM